jgi:hypothetical protein
LRDEEDHIQYIDVSQRHDLDAPELSGVLVALAGLSLLSQLRKRSDLKLNPELAAAVRVLTKHAKGETEWRAWDDVLKEWLIDPPAEAAKNEPDGYPVYKPGVITPPKAPIPSSLNALVPHLRTVRAAYPGERRHVVFLFDSLDRLPSPSRFRVAVEHDVRVLKASGIGVVVVGPIRFMAGTDRALTDLFDYTHFWLATDPAAPEGLAFLTKVLRTRAEPDVLPDESLAPLAQASGGAMRDLITLAKRAGEEAYTAGNDRITQKDVARAIDGFGRGLAVGLDDDMVKTLRHLKSTGTFVIRGEMELSLLETRRVLLYDRNRFVVHPTLAPLLDATPDAA